MATFFSSDSNYSNTTSAPKTITITSVAPAITTSILSGNYTGNSFNATAKVTGLQNATLNGVTTFTLCKDKKGCDQSVSIAREWVQKNAADISAPAPTITEGPIKVRFTA